MYKPIVLHGRQWRIWRLPSRIPPWWVPISPPGGLREPRRTVWPLVLGALHIPYWLTIPRTRPCLVVPCLLERLARAHIEEVEGESKAARPREPAPARTAGGRPEWACLLLVPVLVLHALRNGAFHFLAGLFPRDPAAWPALLGLDTIRVRLFHEFSRCATALFCHADAGHLAGNAAFSLLFLQLLARVAGPGAAILLTLAGGMLGNLANAYVHRGYVLSIGFSTALFACVGALSGFSLRRSPKGVVLPLAAGGALLAMLGTEGDNTDYAAHVCGLLAGMLLGALWSFAEGRLPFLATGRGQWLAGVLALLLLVGTFACALA